MEKATLALLLTWLCSLATVFGGLLIFVLDLGASEPNEERRKHKYNTQLGHSLSFACGVMIYISFSDMLFSSIEDIGFFEANVWMFVGIISFGLLARLVPEPDEMLVKVAATSKEGAQSESSPTVEQQQSAHISKLYTTGLVAALAVTLHNLPEGLAVYLAALGGTHRTSLFFGIFLHNIPEGLAVAMPLYAATGSKWRSVMWASLSGLAEPLGAIVMGSVLGPHLSHHAIQASLASVAGIMIFISMSELYPTALLYIDSTSATRSCFLGMFVVFMGVHLLHSATN